MDIIEQSGSGNKVKDSVHTNENDQHHHDSETQSSDRVTLTSRRQKKHLTFHEPNLHKEISDVEDSVGKLENNFAIGIEEIRQSLELLKSEKKSYELHIKSLEESLKKSNEEGDKCRSLIDQMKGNFELLSAKLEAAKKNNEALDREKRSLQSSHEDHLHSIADQHRRKLLAKKTLRRWKEKLKKSDLPNKEVAKLLEENQKLKNELFLYHESAKHAFLRSASVLNSEALTLFQDTASRLLNGQESEDTPLSNDSRSVKSDISDQSSSNSPNESNTSVEKENEGLNRYKKSNIKFYSDESDVREKKDDRAYLRPHSDNELDRPIKLHSRPKLRTKEFHPDRLRRETKQIMKRLEANRPRPSLNLPSGTPSKNNKNDSCHTKSHIHICHCNPLTERAGNCPFCFANQNYNFVNMQTSSKTLPPTKTKTGQSLDPSKKRKDLFESVSGKKSQVIYRPSGSTVVIEKHMSK